jgi:hypothetical protein
MIPAAPTILPPTRTARIDPYESINRCEFAQNCQLMPDNYLSKFSLEKVTIFPSRRANSASLLQICCESHPQIPLGTALA